jgi:hypothetical protein
MAAAGTSAVLSSAPLFRLIVSGSCHLRLPPPAAASRRRLLRRYAASGGGGDGSDQTEMSCPHALCLASSPSKAPG